MRQCRTYHGPMRNVIFAAMLLVACDELPSVAADATLDLPLDTQPVQDAQGADAGDAEGDAPSTLDAGARIDADAA